MIKQLYYWFFFCRSNDNGNIIIINSAYFASIRRGMGQASNVKDDAIQPQAGARGLGEQKYSNKERYIRQYLFGGVGRSKT